MNEATKRRFYTLRKQLENGLSYADSARDKLESACDKYESAIKTLEKLEAKEAGKLTFGQFIELTLRIKCSYNSLNVFNDIFGIERGEFSYQYDKCFGVFKGDVTRWFSYLDNGNRRLLIDYYLKDLKEENSYRASPKTSLQVPTIKADRV